MFYYSAQTRQWMVELLVHVYTNQPQNWTGSSAQFAISALSRNKRTWNAKQKKKTQKQDEEISVDSFQIVLINFAWKSFDANLLFFFFKLRQECALEVSNSTQRWYKIQECLHIFCIFIVFAAIEKTKPSHQTVFDWYKKEEVDLFLIQVLHNHLRLKNGP